MTDEILKVKNLEIELMAKDGFVKVIKNISFRVKKSKFVGIVGESGAGKTITISAIAGLLSDKSAKIKGKIVYNSENNRYDILNMSRKEKRKICSKNFAIIMQDSMNALNPFMNIQAQFIETIKLHEKISKKSAVSRALDILDKVGINNSKNVLNSYPHQFSGGMRQRISIALALCCNPKILIADEPTTALDAINQMNILNLIKDICEKNDISLIYITHDLGIIANICHDVIVMKDGKIVEKGDVHDIFYNPKDDYTKSLINYANMSFK